ncbi:MAG TPA: DUF1553 domain-containing protein [Pirellulales bacterium]|jgi:hypothetical protein|nr:DUF1553 domain-containing protein [Pirellulales bacterium]
MPRTARWKSVLGGRFFGGLLSGLLVALSSAAAWAEPPPPAAEVEFFERKIRPVLAEHCLQCHSQKQVKGGLRLDSREGWVTGGDSGPAVIPGKPADSPMLQALHYDPNFVQMPPKGRLSAEVVANFERWVAHGAIDPRGGDAGLTAKPKAKPLDLVKARKHWAYQPVVDPPIPPTTNKNWPQGNIDRLILAHLEHAGLAPVEDADRTTLVRRLYFDLIGLPPTPDEINAFVAESSPQAYEELVERLLASPRFGERWARHWLDVVRFAESLTLRGFVLSTAWRYRDYCIEAFNADRPFDRFLLEQVAGDLLPADKPADARRQRIAVAFLTLGNNNLEEQDKQQLRMDVVDEQLDTIGKALLAQTIGCARCHDHKFDPIPTRDYYALAGILRSTRTLTPANVSKWIESPLPLEPEEEVPYAAHDASVQKLEVRISHEREALKTALATADGKAGGQQPEVLDPDNLPGLVVDDSQAKPVGKWKVSQFTRRYIGEGYRHDDNTGKGTKTLTFVPEITKAGKYEVRLAYSPSSKRATAVPVTIFSADGEHTARVNMREIPDFDGRFISLGVYTFEANGQGFVIVSNDGTDGYVTADAVQFIPFEATDKLLKAAKAKFAGKLPAEAQHAADRLRELEKELAALKKTGPRRPTVISVDEERPIEEAHICVRGNVHNQGDLVPRGFLQVANYDSPVEMPSNESGRLELGRWLASPRNPLTSRVMVNRIWHWLLGAGLVRTTDNFGAAGEKPSHPELLDYLATRLVRENWSVKRLVREIVLSRTYRLSSTGNARLAAADPENRLLAHANRRRLDAECIRDAMLCVSGQLDLTAGGTTIPADKTADYGFVSTSTRRSVYLPMFRNSLPDLLAAFDMADPSMVTGVRNVSTVSPQALFMMNNPFVRQQAELTAKRLLDAGTKPRDEQIRSAFLQVLGRSPTSIELERTDAYLQELLSGKSPATVQEAWTRVVQALLGSIDFRYLN